MNFFYNRNPILALVICIGVLTSCTNAPIQESPPTLPSDTLLTTVQEDRGATDIDALAKIMMQALVSGKFDYLERHALPPETYWDSLSGPGVKGAPQHISALRNEFMEARREGELAGIRWPKLRLLTTSLDRQTALPGNRALMDVLVNCEGREFLFKAECARLGLVWFVVGGITFDSEHQGI